MPVDRKQRTSGGKGVIEKGLEDITSMSIGAGMLLPDQRVRRYGTQAIEVAGSQRPQFNEVARKMGSEFKGHREGGVLYSTT